MTPLSPHPGTAGYPCNSSLIRADRARTPSPAAPSSPQPGLFPPFCERLPGAGTSAATHFQLTPRTRAAPQRVEVGTPFRLCFAQSRAGLSLASCAQLRASGGKPDLTALDPTEEAA